MLQLGPLLAFAEPLQRCDYAVWDILPMRLFPNACAIDERARADLRFSGQYLDKKIYKGIGIFPVKLACAETRKWEQC